MATNSLLAQAGALAPAATSPSAKGAPGGHRPAAATRPDDNRGAVHADLMGGARALRYRPQRLQADELNADISCRIVLNGARIGPLPVLDLSATGLAIDPRGRTVVPPGKPVRRIEIDYRGKTIWEGRAEVVYQVAGPPERMGIRFTSGLFDLQLLKLSETPIESRLSAVLRQHQKFIYGLPADWRAAVATVRQLLEEVRELLGAAEECLSEEAEERRREESALFDRLFSTWGVTFHARLRELHERSQAFDPPTLKLARAYARRELLPLVYDCPIHSRAYDKPLGYAGDYRLMLLLATDQLEGNGIFGRFLHHATQNYTLGRAVRSRELCMREAARTALAEGRPVRIAALACGPAIELQNLIRDLDALDHPVELVLIDQDEQTMQYCHEALSRAILAKPGPLASRIRLNCLHLSVLQILKPQGDDERRFLATNLEGVDLIYSAGLYDYLPDAIARRLTRRLYSLLGPGGRLFIGNLIESPDSTWMMEFVSSWHLEYRDATSMSGLARALQPTPASLDLVYDETGHCVFLDARRPRGPKAVVS